MAATQPVPGTIRTGRSDPPAGSVVRAAVDRVMGNYSGLITRAQASAAGMCSSAIDRRVRSGQWRRLLPGVFRPAWLPVDTATRVRAAGLWAGAGGVLSGATAAWCWGITDAEPRTIEITIPRATRRRAPPGITLVRRDLHPLDVTGWSGVRVTGPSLSALHGAVALGMPRGARALDRALQRLCRYDDVCAAHARQKGSHRSAEAARLLRSAGDGAAAESERLLARLFSRAGITGWTINTRLALGGRDTRVAYPDFCFAAERVIVEVDGWAWHHTAERFQQDRRRQNELQLAGWFVLRFTWFDLVERPDWVLAQVRAALARRQR